METPSEDLLQLLVDAKLAGTKWPTGGYFFRSNEEAAELALSVLGDWLHQHVDADHLVVQAALRWHTQLVETSRYQNYFDWQPEVDLAAAVERLKADGQQSS